jgi:MoxR-like ATPase
MLPHSHRTASNEVVFVETESINRYLHEIDLALHVGRPICIEGDHGIGKSFLIEEVAHRHNKRKS